MSSPAMEEPVAGAAKDVNVLSLRSAMNTSANLGHYMAGGTLFVWLSKNMYLRAPWYYKAPQFVGVAGLAFGLGYLIDVYRQQRLTVRSAYVEDFKRTHPELYPETKRLRWGEVLDPWSPRR